MKKRQKTLLILLAVLIAVGGLFALVTTLTKEEDEAAVGEEESSSPILELSTGDVTAFSYSYEGSTLRFERSGEEFILAGEADFPLDQTMVTTMLSSACGAAAVRELDTPSGLSEYGLDEPVLTVSLATAQGEYSLLFGDVNTQTSSVYAMLSGSDKVYLTDNAVKTAFEYTLTDLIRMDDLPEMGTVTLARITNGEHVSAIEYIEENAGLYLSNSYHYFYNDSASLTALDSEAAESYFSSVTTLYPTSCEMWSPDSAALSSRGFDDPVTVELSCSVDVETTDEDGNAVTETEERKVSFYFGNEFTDEEGTLRRYMMFDGSDMIYVISAAEADTVIAPDVDSMLPASVADISFSTLTGAEILLNGETYAFTFGRNSEDERTAALNGTDVSTVYTESFFVDFAALTWEQLLPEGEEPSSPPEMTFSFTFDNESGVSPVTVELSRCDASFYAAQVTGARRVMLVNIRDVESLLDSWAEMMENLEL